MKSSRIRVAVRLFNVLLLVGLLIYAVGPLPAFAGARSGDLSPKVRVIVQGDDAAGLTSATQRNGGRVLRNLDVVAGVSAEVPSSALSALSATPGVKRVALDPPVVSHSSRDEDAPNPGKLSVVYPWALMVPPLWQGKSPVAGQGVGVAVVDSGIGDLGDFGDGDGDTRIVARAQFGSADGLTTDAYGHGTAVAGVLGGSGKLSNGAYTGIAPGVDLISLKVGDDQGLAYVSDVIAAIRWAVEHKDELNIRVLNLSVTSSVPESYRSSVLDMAVEYAWFNGLVVVVAAGNETNGVFHPPANDPYVITVGATDDKGTRQTGDDELWQYSSFGATQDGYAKPDVVAPGRRIVTVLSSPSNVLATIMPDRVIGSSYIRLSGTSLSAGEVSGVVAQILQKHPSYRPNQIKWLLARTASAIKARDAKSAAGTGAGYPNATLAAAYRGKVGSANHGLVPNNYIVQAVAKIIFDGVSWDGVSWDGVSWDGVSWDGVSWDGVSWDGVSWDGVSWDGVSWDGVSWDGVSWDGVTWDGVTWDGVTWDAFLKD